MEKSLPNFVLTTFQYCSLFHEIPALFLQAHNFDSTNIYNLHTPVIKEHMFCCVREV